LHLTFKNLPKTSSPCWINTRHT